MADPEKHSKGMARSVSVVAAVALLMTALSPQVLSAEKLEINSRQFLTLLDRSGGEHMVYWQARTMEQGGTFRLYRGLGLDSLEVVNSEAAVRGVQKYFVSGDTPRASWFVYQLRYVQPSGFESVLTTVVVNQRDLKPDAVTVDLPTPSGKALTQIASVEPVIGAQFMSQAERRPASTPAPSPEVPPPRTI